MRGQGVEQCVKGDVHSSIALKVHATNRYMESVEVAVLTCVAG